MKSDHEIIEEAIGLYNKQAQRRYPGCSPDQPSMVMSSVAGNQVTLANDRGKLAQFSLRKDGRLIRNDNMGKDTPEEKKIRKEAIAYGYRLRKYGGDYGDYRIYDDEGNCLFKTHSICDLEDWWRAHGP